LAQLCRGLSMPRTAHSSAPLFRSVTPLETSEKVAFFDSGMAASLGKVPDDAEKWPAHALSRAHKEMPYLSEFDVSIVMERTDPEAGYGMGYLMLRNRSAQNKPQAEIARPQNYVRVPVIIKERNLLPFKVFELGGRIYPLNKARVRRALVNTSIFDGVGSAPRHSKNLTFDHRPPYQQRQGFGKIYDATAGQAGLGKISSAPAETAQEHLARAREQFAEKKAYGWMASSSDDSWISKFAGTPFYDEAKEICEDSAQVRVMDAQRRAASSARFAAEAHLAVEGAELEAKLAAFKAQTEDVPEGDTLRKLSSIKMGGDTSGCSWDMMFEGTPFYPDALHYCAKEAQLRSQPVDADSSAWRETEQAKRGLEAKLAAWKYEQETGKEFSGFRANVNISLTEGGEQPGPVKQANLGGLVAQAGRQFVSYGMRNPVAGNAALGAMIGAGSGAVAGGPNKRLSGAFKGALTGGALAGGATALAQRGAGSLGTRIPGAARPVLPGPGTSAALPGRSFSSMFSHPVAGREVVGSAPMRKEARIFGASIPGELAESALSYDRRQRNFEDYVDRKRKEAPTPMNTALGTGGGVGAGFGALAGLATTGSLKGGLAGAAIGGLGGMGLGALMQASDAAKIRKAKALHGNPNAIASELDRQILRQVRNKQLIRRMDADRRHRELLRAIENRGPRDPYGY
jgi:hypothetical protein